MKSGLVIGIVVGLIIGALAMFLLVHRGSNSAPGGEPGAGSSPAAPGPMSGSPLIGMWRMNLSLAMAVTYDFKDDGTFTQRFTGVPTPPLGQATSHEAGGTWNVNGSTLIMRNTRSTTPFTVVGEEESAGIISTAPDRLVLLNVDRKGKDEKLTFTRVEPFISGRCDKPAIVGNWQSPDWGQIELRQGGELAMSPSNVGFRDGRWMQQGNRLRLLINPPKFSNGSPRRWNPQLNDVQENIYEIVDLSSDGQTLEIRRVEMPALGSSPPITLRRSTALLQPQSQPPRRRPSGMK